MCKKVLLPLTAFSLTLQIRSGNVYDSARQDKNHRTSNLEDLCVPFLQEASTFPFPSLLEHNSQDFHSSANEIVQRFFREIENGQEMCLMIDCFDDSFVIQIIVVHLFRSLLSYGSIFFNFEKKSLHNFVCT